MYSEVYDIALCKTPISFPKTQQSNNQQQAHVSSLKFQVSLPDSRRWTSKFAFTATDKTKLAQFALPKFSRAFARIYSSALVFSLFLRIFIEIPTLFFFVFLKKIVDTTCEGNQAVIVISSASPLLTSTRIYHVIQGL